MTNPNTSPRRKRKIWPWAAVGGLVLVPAAVFALWTLITLNINYETGEHSGYVQNFSKRGWICKSWEGQLVMADTPGATPRIFAFSVRNDSIASLVEQSTGKRVSLTYEHHRGVPTNCFGESRYFVTNARPTEP